MMMCCNKSRFTIVRSRSYASRYRRFSVSVSAHTLSNMMPVSFVGRAPDACRLAISSLLRAVISSAGGAPPSSQRPHSRRSAARQCLSEACTAERVIRSRTSAVR